MSSKSLPTSVFESLLPKLAVVLELTQNLEGSMTPQARNALLQATNDFKNTLNHAKELAKSLPGGELMTKDQDEVIQMLEQIRDQKRRQLLEFSTTVLETSHVSNAETQMEVDSMASTPSQN
ncbi:hypothetical protein EYR40_009885 [Pleurotus pulmonarius]|nr:hypothetical protein EYR40_009885 [Pleurotus pulmonarius]